MKISFIIEIFRGQACLYLLEKKIQDAKKNEEIIKNISFIIIANIIFKNKIIVFFLIY